MSEKPQQSSDPEPRRTGPRGSMMLDVVSANQHRCFNSLREPVGRGRYSARRKRFQTVTRTGKKIKQKSNMMEGERLGRKCIPSCLQASSLARPFPGGTHLVLTI